VLFGATRRRLLAWLFAHPDEAFYFRELLRATGTPEGAAQRELAALTAAGLLTRTQRGRQVYFQANRVSPVFFELSSLLTKTTGIAGVLRDALRPLEPRIRVALLYGSAARNELTSASDLDVMVVGDVTFGEVVEAMRAAEQTLGREVNPTVYPPSEFGQKVRDGHHFVTAVLQAPYLVLMGNPDELERLGGTEQVADTTHRLPARDSRPAGRRRRGSAAKRR